MGLRAKLGGALIGILLVLTALLALAIHQRTGNDYREAEADAAEASLQRLLLAIEADAADLDNLTGEWSNWGDLHRFMLDGNRDFAAEYLTDESFKTSRVSALNLRSPQGIGNRVIEQARADGSKPISPLLLQPGALVQRYFEVMSGDAPARCGLAFLDSSLPPLLVCDRPSLTSTGQGPSHGRVMMMRWLDEDRIARIGRLTQINFRVQLSASAQAPLAGPLRPLAERTLLGNRAQPWLQLDAASITVAYPLLGLVSGQPVGWLLIEHPQLRLAKATADAWRTLGAVVVLVVLATLAMQLLIDYLVVRRLLRLQRAVDAASHDPQWRQRVAAGGEDELGSLAARVNALLALIESQVERLYALSTTDALTGLANRRLFDERLSLALKARQRNPAPLALILIDVDHFKKYNDRYGHPAGDAVLREVAEALRGVALRATDLVARIGGEEFAVLLEGADLAAGAQVAESCRQAVFSRALAHADNNPAMVTISLGIAVAAPGDTVDMLCQRADQALYAAKQAGRNRLGGAD